MTNTAYDQYNGTIKTVRILHYSSFLDDTRACHMDRIVILIVIVIKSL